MVDAIYCPRRSAAARLLADRLGIHRFKDSVPRRPQNYPVILNWGASKVPNWFDSRLHRFINDPYAVSLSISKVKSYEQFKEAGIATLEVAIDRLTADRWIHEGHNVLARRDGLSGGRGITIYGPRNPIPADAQADFFTKYFRKTHEYRVHACLLREVGNTRMGRPDGGVRGMPGANLEGGAGSSLPTLQGQRDLRRAGVQSTEPVSVPGSEQEVGQRGIIDITQKKRSNEILRDAYGEPGDIRRDVPGNRTLHQRIVRSHSNGYIFAHNNLFLPDLLRDKLGQLAIQSVVSLGLHFGAVDIGYDSGSDSLCVFEVNTAPGLEDSTTIEAYIEALSDL